MNLTDFLMWVGIGLVAGFLAGQVTKGKGFGLFGNLVVGIVGAVIGGVVFEAVGLAATGLLGRVICAFVGAVVLVWIVGLVSNSKK